MVDEKIKVAMQKSFDLIYQACGDNEVKVLTTVTTMLQIISREAIVEGITSRDAMIEIFSKGLDNLIQGKYKKEVRKEGNDLIIQAQKEMSEVLRNYFADNYFERLLAISALTAKLSACCILDGIVSQDNVIGAFMDSVNKYRILFSNGKPKI